jgi:pyruvate dehydrogenase E2 component (dihydrolipoamide acetyltransferase)
MAISIVVPQLGESVAEGTVAKWLKAVGDKVRKEEPLVEIQTDKINVEIPSPAEGVLAAIVVAEGTTVLVGTEIGSISGAAEAAAAPVPAAAPAARAAAPAASPPAASVAVATGDGGNGLATGGSLGHEDDRTLSPAVRRLMREHNVTIGELRGIRGSGTAGRVTRDDLLDYLGRRGATPLAAPAMALAAAAPAAPLPTFMRATTGAAAAGPRSEVVPFTKVSSPRTW